MITRPLFRSLSRPLFRALSGAVSVITKVLIDLSPTADAHYSLSSPILFTGDFEIEIDVLINSFTRFMVFSGGTSANDFELFYDATDGKFSYRVSGVNPSGTTSANNYLTINELRTLKVKRVGTTVTLSSPNRTDYVVTISGSLRINNFAARPSVIDLFLDGIESNIKLTDITTPANSFVFPLANLTGNTETSNGVTLTYQNIGTGNSVRDTYTLINDDYFGSELVVNGDFATDSNWNKGTGWTISGGLANLDITSSFSTLDQTVAVVGLSYIVGYRVSNYVSGDVSAKLGNTDPATIRSADGVYSEFIIPASDSLIKIFNNTAVSEYSIDNVSVKRYIEVA